MPPVVLGTKEEIYKQYGRGCGGDDHQAIADKEEAEHIVDLASPQGGHDEIQLDKDGAEWQNTSKQDGRNWSKGSRGRWNLTWDLVCFSRPFDNLWTKLAMIFFRRTKKIPTCCLKPTQLPATLRGTLITNQIKTITTMVVKGTAPLDCLIHKKKLSRKNTANAIPGISKGVRTILRFHASPPNVLYARAETYPPINPSTV